MCAYTVLLSEFHFLHRIKYWLSYFLNFPSYYESNDEEKCQSRCVIKNRGRALLKTNIVSFTLLKTGTVQGPIGIVCIVESVVTHGIQFGMTCQYFV